MRLRNWSVSTRISEFCTLKQWCWSCSGWITTISKDISCWRTICSRSIPSRIRSWIFCFPCSWCSWIIQERSWFPIFDLCVCDIVGAGSWTYSCSFRTSNTCRSSCTRATQASDMASTTWSHTSEVESIKTSTIIRVKWYTGGVIFWIFSASLSANTETLF